MDRDSIKEMMREVVGPNVVLVDHPEWVGMHCPLAAWKHQKGTDTTPSSGISVKEDGTSIYNCYVCGKGPVSYLLKELEKFTGESFSKLLKTVDSAEFLGGALPDWGVRKVKTSVVKTLGPEYLDIYEDARGHWYLTQRGISDETADLLSLRVDPADSAGDERILFPVFGRNGDLHGFTGRAVYPQIDLRVRDYHGLAKAKLLLGAHLVREQDAFVVVVEGLFDYAWVAQCDYPVVAVMHSGLTGDQARILIDIGKPVVLMYDNDDAGQKGTAVAVAALASHLPVSVVKYPAPASGKGRATCPKDPATCTLVEIQKMIATARIV